MRKYRLCISTAYDENGTPHRCYGVRYGNVAIEDITFSEARMCALIYDMNDGGLEPVHLRSVVEDFLEMN